MNYATPQALLDRYSAAELAQLSDRSAGRLVTADLLAATVAGDDRSAWSADENAAADDALALINQVLADANAAIDGYLGRYSLPLAVVPRSLTRAACEIARFYLYDDAPTEHVTELYQSTVKWLGEIARGNIDLGLSANGEKPAQDDAAQMESTAPIWGRDKSGGFI